MFISHYASQQTGSSLLHASHQGRTIVVQNVDNQEKSRVMSDGVSASTTSCRCTDNWGGTSDPDSRRIGCGRV